MWGADRKPLLKACSQHGSCPYRFALFVPKQLGMRVGFGLLCRPPALMVRRCPRLFVVARGGCHAVKHSPCLACLVAHSGWDRWVGWDSCAVRARGGKPNCQCSRLTCGLWIG
jgi:hypothetical protein